MNSKPTILCHHNDVPLHQYVPWYPLFASCAAWQPSIFSFLFWLVLLLLVSFVCFMRCLATFNLFFSFLARFAAFGILCLLHALLGNLQSFLFFFGSFCC